MFRDGWCNSGPLFSYYQIALGSFEENLPLRATPNYDYLVSGSFHSSSEVLFSFPSRYYYAIGLGKYLGLEVDGSQLHAGFPTHAILESQLNTSQVTPTGRSPSTVPLFSGIRLPRGGGSQVQNTTSPYGLPIGVQFALFPFRSPLLRESLLISFPARTKMLCRQEPQLMPLSVPRVPTPYRERLKLLALARKSHSVIPGSKVACTYPGLIAACHDLHRLPSQAIHQIVLAYRILLIIHSIDARKDKPLHGTHRELTQNSANQLLLYSVGYNSQSDTEN